MSKTTRFAFPFLVPDILSHPVSVSLASRETAGHAENETKALQALRAERESTASRSSVECPALNFHTRPSVTLLPDLSVMMEQRTLNGHQARLSYTPPGRPQVSRRSEEERWVMQSYLKAAKKQKQVSDQHSASGY